MNKILKEFKFLHTPAKFQAFRLNILKIEKSRPTPLRPPASLG